MTSVSAPAAATSLPEIAQHVRYSARYLATLPADIRNQALESIAQALESASATILAANQADCQAAVSCSPSSRTDRPFEAG